MKKIVISIAAMLVVTLTPIQSRAERDPISLTGKESPEVTALINRVNEINAMDRSSMSRSEKKEIRKELRALKSEACAYADASAHGQKRSSGGIFISTGAIILILVLIIIF